MNGEYELRRLEGRHTFQNLIGRATVFRRLFLLLSKLRFRTSASCSPEG
jgi:hypothetical protein